MIALDLLRPLTSPSAQSRGWEYVDRVRVVDGHPAAIEAEVFGSIPYTTRLRADAGELRVWCTCPYFSGQGAVCKHVWATAVAAENRGWLTRLADNMRVVMDFDDVEGRYEFLQPVKRAEKRPE